MRCAGFEAHDSGPVAEARAPEVGKGLPDVFGAGHWKPEGRGVALQPGNMPVEPARLALVDERGGVAGLFRGGGRAFRFECPLPGIVEMAVDPQRKRFHGPVGRKSRGQRLSMGVYETFESPVYVWRGRPILNSRSRCNSDHWASQPGIRPVAKSAVNIFDGVPMAL